MTSAAAALLLAGCSKLSGEIKTSHFMVSSNYEELVVNDGFEVEFSEEAADILITVDEDLLSKVVVRERDGELTIGLKPFTSAHGSPLKAVLPYNRNIDEITLTGASVLRSARPIEGEELSIRLSGASELEAELNADEIDMELSGASVANVNVSGICTELDVELSGASVLRSARPIEGEDLSFNLSGASQLEAELSADEIDMELLGASVAKISGVCAELDVELSGASEIVSQHDAHYRFAAGRAEGSMSGSSKMALHCDGNIDVRLSGSSIIRYTGDARTGGCTLSGGSSIVRDVF